MLNWQSYKVLISPSPERSAFWTHILCGWTKSFVIKDRIVIFLRVRPLPQSETLNANDTFMFNWQSHDLVRVIHRIAISLRAFA